MKLPMDAIKVAAARQGLDPSLVAALIMSETAGDSWRMRFEPTWPYFCRPDEFARQLGITSKTEQTLQRMSYGLLQLMGARARELGFTDHLPKLCILEAGLAWGCLSLAEMAKRFPKRDDLIAAHNAGSPRRNPDGKYVNQVYVDRVLSHLGV